MKRLALPLLIVTLVGVTGCPWWRHKEEKQQLRFTRCAAADACRTGQVCDPATQACVDVCGTACAVDQVSVQVGAGCACVNTDGIGSPCLTDGDCPSVSGSPQVRQLCRAVASPAAGWPATTVCVPEPSCTVGSSDCADPAPASPQVEATCVAIAGNPPGPGACTTTCVDTHTNMRTDCRFDQIPLPAPDGSCRCVSREDPFGKTCGTDADCAWSGGILGDAGPTRACKQVNGKSTCVPVDFCTKEETKGTCGNGVDDDCDGVADDVEPACQTEQCKDLDGDGWCEMMTCRVRVPEAGDVPRSQCRGGEFDVCDAPGQAMRNPGVPESCDGVDNNCDTWVTVDEGCQRFCEDRDGDGWPRSEPQVNQVAPPAGDWVVCSGTEHPSCDDAEHASVHSDAPCGPVEPPPHEIPCLTLHSDPTTFLQLGATLVAWSAKLEQGCPGIPDQTDVSFRNIATSGNGWCELVLEHNGRIYTTGHMGPGDAHAEVLDLSVHAGAVIHMAVWSPGFLGVAGSGGGAAEFRAPRSGHLVISALCQN